MEKVEKNKAVVRSVLEDIAAMIPPSEPVETQVVMDDVRGHYLLTAVGWIGNHYREFNSFVHLDVRPDGKVWVQHDGTDQRIALMLIERGIASKDIVLAFHSPLRREMMPEFAVN